MIIVISILNTVLHENIFIIRMYKLKIYAYIWNISFIKSHLAIYVTAYVKTCSKLLEMYTVIYIIYLYNLL